MAGQFYAAAGRRSAPSQQPRSRPRSTASGRGPTTEGEPQPKPALFIGLFRAENPYLDKLETSYKDLALAMRDGTCDSCHVPNNPEKMKRLVLLQTPAHAAGEIRRLMIAVRNNRMPLDEIGIEKELSPPTKATLLKFGAAFEETLKAAYAWERGD